MNIGCQQTQLCPTYKRRFHKGKQRYCSLQMTNVNNATRCYAQPVFTLIYQFLTYDIEIWSNFSVTQLNWLDCKINKSVKIVRKEPIQREKYMKHITNLLRKVF